MSEAKVRTFFYGSYINPRVLLEVELVLDRVEVARLPGYDIVVAPLANLVPSDRHCVYGVLGSATHAELERLYAHAEQVLGGRYLPHPVVAVGAGGALEPALCYIAPELPAAAPSEAYVMRILEPARELGFPRWYLDRLETFLPGG